MRPHQKAAPGDKLFQKPMPGQASKQLKQPEA
jgi:hypothetical protein